MSDNPFRESAEKYRKERMARHADLDQSRRLVRHALIIEEQEFIAALSNIQANTKSFANTRLESWKDRLVELLTDIDAEVNELPPEVPEYCSERAEFDARTPMNNRTGSGL